MTTTTLAAESSAGNPILNNSIFAIFLIVTMAVVLRAGKTTKKASDFYTGGGSFSGRQNGLAISGDYLSAASFLGIVGAVALNGYDGFLYSVGFFVAWLVALMLVAEPMRNVGRFTMADVLSFRLKQKPVRVAASIATLFVTLFYLIAQMAGAGSLVAVLLDIHDFKWQALVVGIVGVLMIVYVLVGGMKGTTYVQMIKAVLLVAGVVIMCFLVFIALRGGFSTLFNNAIDMHAASEQIKEKGYEAKDIMAPGLKYGATTATKLDFISLGISLVLGVGGLPHVLMRFYTVPTATEARRSVTWAIVIIGAFYLMTLVLGYGQCRGAATRIGDWRLHLHGDYFCRGLRYRARRGGWPGHYRLGVHCARYLPRGDPQWRVHRGRAGPRLSGHRGGPRYCFHHHGHPGHDPERGLPGLPGICGGGLRQPADHPVLPVLAPLQHRGRGGFHVYRRGVLPGAHLLLPGSLRF